MIWPEETGASCYPAFMLRRIVVVMVASGYAVMAAAVAAFLVGALAAPFLPYILAGTEVCPDCLHGFDSAALVSGEMWTSIFLMGLLSAYVAGAVTILIGLLVGLPLYLGSRRLRRGNTRLYAAVGGMISLLLCAMLLALQDTGFEIFVALRFPLVAILLAGPMAALTFRQVVAHVSRQGR